MTTIPMVITTSKNRFVVRGESDQLWRIRITLASNKVRNVKMVDDYSQLWTSEKAFVVLPTEELEEVGNECLDELHKLDNPVSITFEAFPFDLGCESHSFTLVGHALEHPNLQETPEWWKENDQTQSFS